MRKLIFQAAPFVLLILLGISISGCGSSSSTPVNPITPILMSISPATVTLSEGDKQQFTATVTGTTQTAVVWGVTGCTDAACGTISSTGLYTAPFDISTNATVTVVATLVIDPKTSATATVNHVPPNITRGEAQGVYSGTSFCGVDGTSYIIVLPNDAFYALYRDFWGSGELMNMMTGQGKSASGTFTANATNFFEDTAVPVTLTVEYVPGVSMTGSVTVVANNYKTTFDATALPSSLFQWHTLANLADITGTWGSITINPDGTFMGNEGDCSYSGTITPDSSNKSFFNLTITYGGPPCPTWLANQSARA